MTTNYYKNETLTQQALSLSCNTTIKPRRLYDDTTRNVHFHPDVIVNVKGQPKTKFALIVHDNTCVQAPTVGILDSGATDSFVPMSYKGTNEQITHQKVVVGCANGATMVSTATDELDLPSLPAAARTCYKFADIAEPLVSVKKIVKSGCNVLFEATKVTIRDTNTGKPVLTGKFDPIKNLYTVPLHERRKPRLKPRHALPGRTQPRHATAYGATAYEPTTLKKHITYLHACAGYPTKRTWMKAIDRDFYITWPNLTSALVSKYLDKSHETTYGHLKLVRQGIRSSNITTRLHRPPQNGMLENSSSETETGRTKTHHIGFNTISPKDLTEDLKHLIATDLPGRFPITSARGHKYLFLMYDYDANYIKAVPIKSRESAELVRGMEECYATLTKNNFKAKILRLDNEVSKKLITYIEKTAKFDYQLDSPHNHRAVPARLSKPARLTSFPYSVEYTDNCWDVLIPHTNLTLNGYT